MAGLTETAGSTSLSRSRGSSASLGQQKGGLIVRKMGTICEQCRVRKPKMGETKNLLKRGPSSSRARRIGNRAPRTFIGALLSGQAFAQGKIYW